MKKNYLAPDMRVIKLKQKHALLQGSPKSLMLQRHRENDDPIIDDPDDIH